MCRLVFLLKVHAWAIPNTKPFDTFGDLASRHPFSGEPMVVSACEVTLSTRLIEHDSPLALLGEDEVGLEQPAWTWYPHRWAGGAFTTDYQQLRRLLPSPPLYPVRVSRDRALVCVWGAHISAAGHQPPFLQFGEVALVAFVTHGDQPAPPLVPGLGRRAMEHYGFGFFPLMIAVTNPLAARMYQGLCGIPARIADIRVEQRIGWERFVCECDGQLVWDLTVRSDGQPSAEDREARDWFYAVEDGQVYRLPLGVAGVSRSRYGGKWASLVLGDHPLADPARLLDLSRSWAAEFTPDRQMWLAGPAERLGPTGKDSEAATDHRPNPGRLVVSPAPGVEVEIDQETADMGWDQGEAFTRATLDERSVPALHPDSRRKKMRIPKPVNGIFANGMAYARWGTGRRSLLFIPGGPSNVAPTGIGARMMFRPIRPLVEEGFTVWQVVNRQNLPQGHSVADMADDYAELIAKEFDGKVDLVLGTSYGGLICFPLAAKHPESFDHIAIAVSGHEVSEKGKALDYEAATRHSRGDSAGAFAVWMMDDMPEWTFPGASLLLRGAARVLGSIPAALFYRKTHSYFESDVMVEAEAEVAFDAREILHEIDVPVLIIAGRRDTFFPPEITEETARLMPDATLKMYEDRGHGGVIFDKRFPRDLLEFIEAKSSL